ncbi:hypothetical protein [Mycobacterium sp. 1274756.6]|uniref:hypothetical protein n=1 Tax=Mycobacterium sp. 1274756.6 TaxID=1834076 RepID=UPI000801558D|nr:hypothetical protein [Mycobacterium sp. 1274756.6]OBJ69151.1 hypothetical protein A5643_13085 [Mycobacterium sp. 1274756.6]
MTEPIPSASDLDIAEQAMAVDDEHDDVFDPDTGSAEANPADVYDQHQSVPLDDDDYPSG